MRIRSLFICVVGALVPHVAGAGPLTPMTFIEVSTAGAQETGSGRLPDSHAAFNDCQGDPLVCEVEPTAATQFIFRTDSNAFTDGFGGSGLALHSRDGHVEAEAATLEDSLFDASGGAPVDVHIHGFFPVISLVGIFAPGSELVYDIELVVDAVTLFHTHGVLTNTSFTATGDDIGAIYNAHDHRVSAPAFFFDRTVTEGEPFGITVRKSLKFTGTDWVEIADARMADPESVSAPGIGRNGVEGVVADVPEPASISLFAIAAAGCVARRRTRLPR